MGMCKPFFLLRKLAVMKEIEFYGVSVVPTKLRDGANSEKGYTDVSP